MTQLKRLFPHFRLALPPKRWFGDNFERDFLDDRLLGLQAFLNNVAGHKDVVASAPVRRFFCLDDPPGPHDSVEESRVSAGSRCTYIVRLYIHLVVFACVCNMQRSVGLPIYMSITV